MSATRARQGLEERIRRLENRLRRWQRLVHLLRARERQWLEMLDSVGDCITLVDEKLKAVWANRNAKRLASREIRGLECHELFSDIPKPCHSPERCLALQTFADGQTHECEMSASGGDNGEIQHFLSTASVAQRGRNGRPVRVIEISRNVSRLKKSEILLLESEQRYKKLLAAVTDYIYTVDVKNGKPLRTEHGAGCIAVTGYAPEEYVADPYLWIRMVHEEDRPEVERQAARVLAGHAMPPLEHRIVCKDGTCKWVRNTMVARYDENGRLVAYDALVRNISDRKRAEEEMARLRRHNELILHSMDEGVICLNLEGEITFVNHSGAAMLGYEDDELCRQSCETVMQAGNEESEKRCPVSRVVKEGRACAVEETIFRGKDGSAVPVEYCANPIREEGECSGIVVTFRNITKRRELEEERRSLQKQLFHAQKMESIGRMAGGVAHDFNNLLTTILGYNHLALGTLPEDHAARDYLETVSMAGEKAAVLTRKMLAVSRRQFLEMKAVRLDHVVESMIKMLRGMASDKVSLELKTSKTNGSRIIKADQGQLEQVLMNLTVNACDAMPAGGRCIIEVKEMDVDRGDGNNPERVKPGSYAVLSVTDTGSGMSGEVKERIFDPFYTTKEPGKGTGLGLATVYGIVEQHCGHIQVDTEEGRGTTFTVYFPIERPDGSRRAESYQGQIAGGGMGRRNAGILMVNQNARRTVM